MNSLRRIAMAGAVAAAMVAPAQAQDEYTIALIPGLTTDAFYITMHRGAQAAADALGVDLVFQGAPEFNPTVQVPVLDAVIARGPDAILIAPTDVTQLIEPLRAAHEAGIPVITVDTFIDDGMYQDGFGDGDFPIAYIASDNVLGGMMAARALAESIEYEGAVYVSNVTPGISTTDQREEGFRLAMEEFPRTSRCLRHSSTTMTRTPRRLSFRPCWRVTRTCAASSAPTCSRPLAPLTA